MTTKTKNKYNPGELYFDGVGMDEARGAVAFICARGIDGNLADVYGESSEEAERAARHIIRALNSHEGHEGDDEE